MALRVSLRFLTFVLLLLMLVHGSSAREMKVLQEEQVEQKEENQHYITGYRGPPVSKGDESPSEYKAAYTSKNHNHQSEDNSYTSQYKAAYTSGEYNHPSEDDSYASQYETAYTSKNLNHPSEYDSYASQYEAEYTSKKHNLPSEEDSHATPYKAAYTSKKFNHPSEDESQYKAAYTPKRHNLPSEGGSYTSQYKAAYHSRKHIHPMHQQDNDVHGSFQNYLTGYSQKHNVHGSSQNYLIGYLHKHNVREDDSYSGYNVAYSPRKRIHQQDQKEMGKPYITAYVNSDSEKYSENSQKDSEEKNQPNYITIYGDPKKNSQKDSKEKNQSNYITIYGDSKENTEKDTSHQDPNYITTYGGKKESYYRTTGKVSEEGGKPSKVDHTEAFKTGFFALDDIYVGNTMTLQFPVQDFAHFLSRKEADSIPFSTLQLPSVLQLFSVTEDSHEGQAMRDTLEQCELETITGETKVCVASLESMIEFVQSILGTEDKYNILTTSYPSESSASLQNYTIVKVSEDIYAPKWVACHPLPYHYAVFFCHFINTGSRIFKVSQASENGDKMEALGLCHMDTSDWSADHILFQQLGFKPGEAPVCHFLPVKHLLWVPLPSKGTM